MTNESLRKSLDLMLDELESKGMGLRELSGTQTDGEVIIVLAVRGDEKEGKMTLE